MTCWRPNHAGNTSSLLHTHIKASVLGWETALEVLLLVACVKILMLLRGAWTVSRLTGGCKACVRLKLSFSKGYSEHQWDKVTEMSCADMSPNGIN